MTLASLFNTVAIGVFGTNYLLFLVGIALILAIILFAYRFTGPEGLLVINVISWGLFDSGINPIFTSLFAAAVLADAVFFGTFIWSRFAQGGQT